MNGYSDRVRAGSLETCTVDFKYFFNGITYYFSCFVKLQIVTPIQPTMFVLTLGVPTRTGKIGKPEKWECIFQSGKSQGILNRLEKSGKITQNTGKLGEFQKKIICYFLVIFK